jgi:cytochrome c6
VKKATRMLAAIVVLAVGTASAADLAAAKDNFNTFCVKCHGTSGKGDGPSGATLKVKPRDFADCARMAKESDETLFKVIKEGGEANGYSKDMAPFKDGFDDSEIHDLVAYVRTFCKK